MSNLIVIDGMLSGTGVRDGADGGYIEPEELGVSAPLQQKLSDWLLRYEDAHYHQFEDQDINNQLDDEGLGIARMIRSELSSFTVKYFSSATLREIDL